MLHELYDAGYAVRTYNINNDVQDWQFWNERFRTTGLPTEERDGMTVARIEDVRNGCK